MGALRGDIARISDIKRKIAEMPKTVAAATASRAAPRLTTLTVRAFNGGRTVYGDARPIGKDGRALTLRKSGATERDLRFEAHGTIIRCKLGPKWAKYLIGRYAILPAGNAAIPAQWSADMQAVVAEVRAAP